MENLAIGLFVGFIIGANYSVLLVLWMNYYLPSPKILKVLEKLKAMQISKTQEWFSEGEPEEGSIDRCCATCKLQAASIEARLKNTIFDSCVGCHAEDRINWRWTHEKNKGGV